MKPFFKSKTLWVNLIVAVVAFFPAVREIVTPEYALAGVAFINILLRVITKDKIILTN